MPGFKIIANPLAGRGRGTRAVATIQRVLSGEGVTFDLTETRGPHDAIRLAREAAGQAYEAIVAVGGDGTAHEVVNGIVQGTEGLPAVDGAPHPIETFGLVPIGTGNDFAWRLGLPIDDPAAACRILLTGRRRLIDLGQVTDERGDRRVFANELGAGIEAATAFESFKIKRLRGLPLYFLALLRTLPRYRHPPDVAVHYNGAVRKEPMLLVAASNGRRTGGGFLIAPHSQLDDGLLDLTMGLDPDLLSIIRLMPLALRGTHARMTRYVVVDRASQLVIESQAGLPVHLDGEFYRADALRLDICVLPGRLNVIAS
jgi:diacylglycerol kinase (ATP)